MKYDVDYFINRLSAIPEEEWTHLGLREKTPEGVKCCVLGHLGAKSSDGAGSEAAKAFCNLMETKLGIEGYAANDATSENYGLHSKHPARFNDLGETPKERVLTALELIKAGVSI